MPEARLVGCYGVSSLKWIATHANSQRGKDLSPQPVQAFIASYSLPTMIKLQESDIPNFIFDLELYCGTIREISDVRGSFQGQFTTLSGVVHTWMDSFNFSVMGMFCTEDAWEIRLADPVACLRKGHRRELQMKFPKIHKDPALVERYQMANTLYKLYNSYSNVTEDSRRPDLEALLGYSGLPTYMSVINAIVADFRSYGEKLKEERLAGYAKN